MPKNKKGKPSVKLSKIRESSAKLINYTSRVMKEKKSMRRCSKMKRGSMPTNRL
jgi:hypothetical protein